MNTRTSTGADLHLLQRIAQVRVAQLVETHRLGIVRGDGDEGHAFGGEVVLQLLDALLVGLRGRTVVAGEHEDEHARGGVLRERV
ncbi:MAG TPA: hypothetical protein VFK70_11580, partial [Vicinamibacteria bacterium]|nr:hypothetical protein [Vicinamibacteria bacterium]